MASEVKLPELAEGVEKGEVISVLVKAGDTIQLDDPIVEIQSEKATLTVPSSAAGKVSKVLVKAGDQIKVGTTLIEVDDGGTSAAAKEDSETRTKTSASGDSKKRSAVSDGTDNEPGSDDEPAADRVMRNEEPEEEQKPAKATVEKKVTNVRKAGAEFIPAGPAVRRIARELGIDLANVQGSGRNGRISVEDLDPYIKGHIARQGGGSGMAGVPAIELPDFSKWGAIRKQKADALRRKIAEKMAQSWSSIPHVHQFHDCDVTDLLALTKRHKERVKEAGGALTLTVFAMKAVTIALQEFPQFNSSYDAQSNEMIFKDYFHIGVAVDTEAGLIVPVVRDVDKKPVLQLAKEIQELAQKTRDRKIALEELRGGTFTISNLGGIGGTHFTPIVNSPEVAILGIGRASKRPTFAHDGTVVARDIVPLALGYDHRVIDGADGARFIVRVGEILENFEATFLGF